MSVFTFYDELKIRWKSDSPKFFVTLRKFWIWLTSISAIIAALTTAQIEVLSKGVPELWIERAQTWSGIITLIGLISAAQTRFAVQTPTSTVIHEAAKTETKKDDEALPPNPSATI
jgi:hypothetical protein